MIQWLKNLFMSKPKEPKGEHRTYRNPYTHKDVTFFVSDYENREKYLVYRLYKWQHEFAENEVNKINIALSQNDFTKQFFVDFSELEYGEYIFNPYTPKGKIKLTPCTLNLWFREHGVLPVGLSIVYDIYDNPKTANFSHSYVVPKGDAYTITLHYVNDAFHVTKIIMTDSHNENHKLFHIRKEDVE